jgi:hypothetical protein
MRLRVAIHAGEVHPDGTGFGGESIVAVMRLIGADTLRDVLKRAPGDLVVILSEQLHHDVVVQSYRAIDPAEYRQAQVSAKEFRATGWIRTPGVMASPPGAQTPSAAGQPLKDAVPGQLPETAPAAGGGAHSAGGMYFAGPTSFGGHAAGRDVNVRESPPGRRRDV